uniref:condensation domain-containing protein n=1 Tax=Nonomuraea lactucae TaxID=2249762 RepID=UPI001F06297A
GGGKRLIGYVVPEGPVDAAELRSFMRGRLPDYMVPAVFMTVDGLPLTANGKVDRKALPEPDAVVSAGVEYVPPRTASEVVLAGIWSQVLGVERVGLHDNFFELGGDSILSLQIVARARAAGLRLDVADVFARQSVGELAVAVQDSAVSTLADQGLVVGMVPLTPIQHWFTEQDIADRDHWNWSGMFELASGVDAAGLARAVDAVISHHDALRMRFVYDSVVGAWAQSVVEGESGEVFSVVDAAGMDGAQVAERMTLAQTSLSLADGPLIKVVYFDRGEEPGWLGIIVHHLVMDGVSWNVLLEDLDRAYRGERLPAKTTSFQQWAEQLHLYAGTERVREQLPYWKEQVESGFAVPVDDATGANTEASSQVVRVSLDAETTSALLTRAQKAYRTQINDLLLAALLQALGEWAGTDAVTIDLESHGREAIAEEIDLSRTVGWFTSIFPVRLAAADLTDPAVVLKSVKEQLRSSPDRGVGYGALRYLTGELGQASNPQVIFNYMGGADRGVDDSIELLRRELSGRLCGPTEGKEQTRSHLFQVEAAQAPDGEMVFEWYYSANVHRAETVERVAETYVRALKALVEHCLAPEAGGFTPSDFPLANLSTDSLASIMKQMGGSAETR